METSTSIQRFCINIPCPPGVLYIDILVVMFFFQLFMNNVLSVVCFVLAVCYLLHSFFVITDL